MAPEQNDPVCPAAKAKIMLGLYGGELANARGKPNRFSSIWSCCNTVGTFVPLLYEAFMRFSKLAPLSKTISKLDPMRSQWNTILEFEKTPNLFNSQYFDTFDRSEGRFS